MGAQLEEQHSISAAWDSTLIHQGGRQQRMQ